ncbi:MAG: hypothetical protein ACI4VJ_04925 [Methanosphaera sp.]|uniref:hypothetical protein n=1 Tax=Methanosphaera TaxID=2316 RepID=UPI002380B4A1|nr:hypothetical protein [Candidatus Methanosphaera massiliense]MDD6286189.1 hypothetical protein [Methanobacteriaceae archaeon]MDE4077646.1 hypothetical protein [Candidatus Methanosphaera massiliense]MDY2745501.1 hypothetical protein [Methanosphaera sp.]
MVQSVILYSEIIPTVLAIVGLYFIGTGVLDHKRLFTVVGVILFCLAVIVPFAILTTLI